jgi:hypothetical protein
MIQEQRSMCSRTAARAKWISSGYSEETAEVSQFHC